MKSVLDTVLHYKEMERLCPASGMLREVQQQYADMATGGDGGELGYVPNDYEGPPAGKYGVTCRAYNYPNHPDSFFQEVCSLMGWRW
tara:strand:+ start:164 stop:424 length:261 start_codon:yes stop_codon:yes gene_type:complete